MRDNMYLELENMFDNGHISKEIYEALVDIVHRLEKVEKEVKRIEKAARKIDNEIKEVKV